MMNDDNLLKKKISRLALGTAQFGLAYGVNNQTGKPARAEALTIIKQAFQAGITTFDTAEAYGESEEILGEFILLSPEARDKIKIISKSRPKIMTNCRRRPEDVIAEKIKNSLLRLKMESLDGFLLHDSAVFYNKDIIKGLERCRNKGLIKHFGVSIYETRQALDAVSSGLIDYIQIPYNVFDQRLDRTDFFKIAGANKVTVFARSPFLQGLLFMNDERMPKHLAGVKKYLKKFDEIIKKHDFNRLEASFLFSFMNPAIDYVVFGVDGRRQLDEIIKIVTVKKESFGACLKELALSFIEVEKYIISPNLWV